MGLRFRNFRIYLAVGVFTAMVSIILLWLLIDILGFSTVYSSVVIVCGMFVFKFLLYEKIGFIK